VVLVVDWSRCELRLEPFLSLAGHVREDHSGWRGSR
jgi:hypothetical protein